MTRPELGKKRIDPENGRKFYDLGQDPVVSPYTGTAYPLSFFEPPASERPRRVGVAPRFVRREEEPEAEADETRDGEETVSLTAVEEDEEGATKVASVDGEEDDEAADDEGVLALDEDEEERMTEIIDSRRDDD